MLPCTPRDGYAELGDFLNKLTEAVASRQDATTGGKRQVSKLKRLTLENIGPFDNLTLEFNSDWTAKPLRAMIVSGGRLPLKSSTSTILTRSPSATGRKTTTLFVR